MKHLYFLFVIMFHISLAASASEIGKVSGRVINQQSGQALPGVAVKSEQDGKQYITDVEGYYHLNLPAGTHTLQFSSTGFSLKTVSSVTVQPGKVTELNVTLQPGTKDLQSVTVTASTAKRETVASVLSMQRNNISVSDGISAELIKRTPDNNVGEVLKRVTGTSVQEEKYVIVRGLNDRYNAATINGALMPSTETDRKTFSFDVIPSSMIDNVMINKTATPDMPGEFSGGIIQVSTKDIPARPAFSIGLGTSYNTISTGKNFEPGMITGSDYFGFDNGRRAFPASFPSNRKWRNLSQQQKVDVSRKMNNNYGDRYDGQALPGISANMSFATRKNFRNNGILGVTGALNYKNTQSIEYGVRRAYMNNFSRTDYLSNYVDTTSSFTTNVGGLLNIGFKKGNHKLVLKNLFNRIFENANTLREGPNYNDLQYVKKSQVNVVQQKTLFSSQLEGEHKIRKRKQSISWNINYAFTARDQPDYKVLPYQAALGEEENKDVTYKVATRNTYRFWSYLAEHTIGGKADYKMELKLLNMQSQFKAGLLTQVKQRDFSARIFRYEQAPGEFNQLLASLPPHQVFNDGNMYQNGFYLNDITNTNDKYDANAALHAAYAMLDNKITEKLRVIWGLRVESFGFVVNTFDMSGSKQRIKKNYLDVLPSLNTIFKTSSKSNIRLSVSQTVSRADFRELANFAYWDFNKSFVIHGNPDLERSQNTNLDLRFETYPTPGEIISSSVFYKNFRKPIEQALGSISSPEYKEVSYVNPESAYSFGIELDLRKKLSFINQDATWLDNLVLSANAAYIRSRINKGDGDFSFWDEDRPMQGQSPYLVNLGLSYHQPKQGLTTSIMYNKVGHRIEVVGNASNPDIYENGRGILDLQVAKKFAKNKGEIKLTVSNLLDAAQVLYENTEDKKTKRGYNEADDRIIWSKHFGRTISLGFNYNF